MCVGEIDVEVDFVYTLAGHIGVTRMWSQADSGGSLVKCRSRSDFCVSFVVCGTL